MTRGTDIRPFVIAPGVGLLALLVGLRPGDALLVALVTLVIGVVAVVLGSGQTHEFPPVDLRVSDGTRLEVATLTWSFIGRDGRVAEASVRRLRGVAARRLATVGVLLPPDRAFRSDHLTDDEHYRRARELLGERAWRTLTTRGGWMPSLRDVSHCVDALERLRPTTTPVAEAATAPSRTAPETRPATPSERPTP